MSASADPLLTLDRLSVGFAAETSSDEVCPVLREVSLSLDRGECLGLVGESGCGKSLTALAILGLLPGSGRVLGGEIHLAGFGDLTRLSERQRRAYRGRHVAMIFQEPMSALNPVLTLGFQIGESLRAHLGMRGAAARRRTLELLERVAMPDPERRLRSYPHELSGGQRQRAMIALALACEPRLLLADEPTTALDVTVQAQILGLLETLRRELDLSVLLISHDLGVVSQHCDRVAVMYAGQVVEQAPIQRLFERPGHPYTRALLEVMPRLRGSAPDARGIPGRVPEFSNLPAGCSFHPRCPEAWDACRAEHPRMAELGGGHSARCLLHGGSGKEEAP